MNAKLCKSLRRVVKKTLNLDPRDASYVKTKARPFLNGNESFTITLNPDCGRDQYRRIKKGFRK